MKVLVAYGSKRGGTEGLARMLGDDLTRQGLEVDVRPAAEVRDLRGYEAVVVGGALYTSRWHKDARRFVKRHAIELRGLPVWLFSSGPLDDSASTGEIPPTPMVTGLLAMAQARGHRTFGGRLAPDARGFPASSMAKKRSGDWRDPGPVAAWAGEIAEALQPHPVGA